MNKQSSRVRRARRTRAKIKELRVPRLCVYRTPRHIYAQVFGADSSSVLASASTLDKTLRQQIENGGNVNAASLVGRLVAERARSKGVERVAFDRGGYKYHGRVRALADAARESGLKF
ncbi:MAG: 50S ribosomal protein L18 [Gammaproteobacteria bacterium]